MPGTFATVNWDSDLAEWTVVYGEVIASTHDTKQEAIDAAKDIDDVNCVMAFTKGNSNIRTINA